MADGVNEMDGPSLLLVEDDPLLAQTLARALGRRGYLVEVCHTTGEARRAIERSAPEFAVVDLRLPDGSGLCLVRTLHEADPQTSIVVLTGYASIATAIEAVKLGARNYLCKPVDAQAIVTALTGRADPCGDSKVDDDDALTVPQIEQEHISRVLHENQQNISATARALGMHRRTLQRKLTKLSTRVTEAVLPAAD